MSSELLSGRYRIGDSIGEGGMGEVFRGHDATLDRVVAIKRLRRDLARDGDGIERLRREVRLQARIPDKRHVVEVFDLVEQDRDVYVVMEYIEGSMTLRSKVAAAGVGQPGGLVVGEARAILRDTLAGLVAVHGAGVVHGDVKAENYLLARGGQWKLADFGLSRLQTEASLRTLTMGTARNVAPEVFEGRLVPASDVYSLGMMLYELYVGATAFAGEFAAQVRAERADLAWMRWHCDAHKQARPAHEVNPFVPEEVSGWLCRMLVKDAGQRMGLAELGAAVGLAVSGTSAGGGGGRPQAEPGPGAHDAGGAAAAADGRTAPLVRSPRSRVGRPLWLAAGGLLLLSSGAAVWHLGGFGEGGLAKVALQVDTIPDPVRKHAALVLTGKVVDATGRALSVRVGDQSSPVPNGTLERPWRLPLDLRPGRHPLDVQVVDAQGQVLATQPVEVALDTQPPQLAAPLKFPDLPTREPSFKLVGMATDDIGIAEILVNDQKATLTGDDPRECSFSATIPLAEGSNPVRVELRDVSGRALVANHSIPCDRTPPLLAWSTPSDGQVVQGPEVQVEGQVSDLHGEVRVTVNEVPVAVEHGRFAVRVDATNGLHVVATDRAGNPADQHRSVRVDRRAPVFELREKWIDRTAPLRVHGVAKDDVGIDKVTVDGRELALGDPSGAETERSFSWEVKEATRRTVRFVATDLAGRTSERMVDVVLDLQVPVLEVDPLPASVSTERLTVSGFVTDDDPGVQVVMQAGGRERKLDVGETAGRRAIRGEIDLKEGQNEIQVVATDPAGNQHKFPATVTYSRLHGVGRWGKVLRADPDPEVVKDVGTRRRLEATRWPWKVQDSATGIVLLLMPPGEFDMGSDTGDDDEKPVHRVQITQPFYLGETEVTVGQWKQFAATGYRTEAEAGDGAWTLDSRGSWAKQKQATWRAPVPDLGLDLRDEHPVAAVSWNDAKAFCDQYGFVLPSEAQWEYACRAGTATEYWWGDAEAGGAGNGNFADQTAKRKFPNWTVFPFDDRTLLLAPVGSYSANPWGLRDVLGNVWEWCADWYDSDYYGKAGVGAKDPPGPTSGVSRVLRGGSFRNAPGRCRSATRNHNDPPYRGVNVGFRVARTTAP